VTDRGADCRAIVRATPWLMEALAAVRAHCPVPAYIGAGAVRAAVWDALHGHPPGRLPADIDVVFHDAADTSRARDEALRQALALAAPRFGWDVTNQAGVHLWYHEHFGGAPVAAFGSLAEGIATWPETATAVALRLTGDDAIDIVAPFGLSDLMTMVVRWNPARVGRELYMARVARKDYGKRWPRVTIVPA
jgi:hypothetical protein